MLSNILIGIGIVILVLVFIVVMKPNEFRVTRSTAVSAPPGVVFAHVNDFHKWEAWSPWAKLDPNMKQSYEGAPAGVGAIYRWDGNKDVGTGSTTITESRPNERIGISLNFLRPFACTNNVEFTFKPEGNQTVVTWSMSGKSSFICKAMSLVMSMDKMVGGQFEQGLAALKSIAETGSVKQGGTASHIGREATQAA